MFNNLPRKIELMGLQFYIQYLDHKVGVLNCNSLPRIILDRDLKHLVICTGVQKTHAKF